MSDDNIIQMPKRKRDTAEVLDEFTSVVMDLSEALIMISACPGNSELWYRLRAKEGLMKAASHIRYPGLRDVLIEAAKATMEPKS